MAPAIPNVSNAEEANLLSLLLMHNSIVRYRLLPGTSGMILMIKKVVAGTFISLASDSLYIEATMLAKKFCKITFSNGLEIKYVKKVTPPPSAANKINLPLTLKWMEIAKQAVNVIRQFINIVIKSSLS